MIKEVLKLVGLGLMVFVLGVIMGAQADVGGKYLAGQLNACNKIVKMDPILALAQVTCVAHEGQVALQVGEKLYSLDGAQLN